MSSKPVSDNRWKNFQRKPSWLSKYVHTHFLTELKKNVSTYVQKKQKTGELSVAVWFIRILLIFGHHSTTN